MAVPESLRKYKEKRAFDQTPEPAPAKKTEPGKEARFVVQKHDASRLHYDFRLEADGVLKSWAVPKGPSMNPRDKRLAVMTEDHPLEYADFEGVIPEDQYGGGTVLVWDKGTFHPKKEGASLSAELEQGHAEVVLNGEKLCGGFVLIHSKMGGNAKNWLLIKMRDNEADPDSDPVQTRPESVLSGRTIDDIRQP